MVPNRWVRSPNNYSKTWSNKSSEKPSHRYDHQSSSPQPVVTRWSMTGRRSVGLNNLGSTSVLRWQSSARRASGSPVSSSRCLPSPSSMSSRRVMSRCSRAEKNSLFYSHSAGGRRIFIKLSWSRRRSSPIRLYGCLDCRRQSSRMFVTKRWTAGAFSGSRYSVSSFISLVQPGQRGRFAASHRMKRLRPANTRKPLVSDWSFVRRWRSHWRNWSGSGSAIACLSSRSLYRRHCWRSSYSWRSTYRVSFIRLGFVSSLPCKSVRCITWRWVSHHDRYFDDGRDHVAKRHRSPRLTRRLKALGWTNGAIRQLIVLEGFLVGLISGVIGLIVAYTTIYVLYDLVPWNEKLLIACPLALPILFGVIAAFVPAQLAHVFNRTKNSKMLRKLKSCTHEFYSSNISWPRRNDWWRWHRPLPGTFALFPYVPSLIERLRNQGILLIAFTNQPGVSRGFAREEEFRTELQDFGFDDTLICPHAAEDCCTCRKPSPHLLQQAQVKHDLRLEQCVVIGDDGVIWWQCARRVY